MNIPAIVGLFSIHLFIIMGMGLSNLGSFIDIPSLQIVVGITIASSFVTSPLYVVRAMPAILKYAFLPTATNPYAPKTFGELKPFIDMFESMSRVAVGAGIVGTTTGLILMLGNMSDVESIGPNMAVALITLLYGAYLSELIIQPVKRMIISRFETSPEIEERYLKELELHQDPKEKGVRVELLLFAIFLPILVFFVLLLSFLDVPKKEKELSVWEKNTIAHLAIEPISLNGKTTSLFEVQYFAEQAPENLVVINGSNGLDSITIQLDTLNFEQLNSSELMMRWYIGYYSDSLVTEAYEFDYPVSLKEQRTILYENNSISVEFLVTPVLDTVQ